MRFKKFAKRNRVVLDTNIVVSGLLNPTGTPSRILHFLVTGLYELLLTEEIYLEYSETLERFPKIAKNVRRGLLLKIKSYAAFVRSMKKIHVIKSDPADNKFLECALAGKAKYIVSGDSHLLDIRKFRGILILTASEYLKILTSTLEG